MVVRAPMRSPASVSDTPRMPSSRLSDTRWRTETRPVLRSTEKIRAAGEQAGIGA